MILAWQPWSSVAQGSSTPGAPVAAVPWGDSFALFISDPEGGIYGIKATPGFGWELVPGRNSKPGTPITAIASGDLFTLFMADVTGEIFTTSGAPYQGWKPWTSVSEGSSTPGALVAAVPWGDSFALFISDPNGGIYGIKATPGFGWELVPGRSTKPGAPITAIVSGNRFTLFMADVTGEIFTTSGLPYQGWDPWTSVSEGSSTPGAPVAAVPWEGSFALFISDPNGGIYGIKATPGFGWELVPGRSTKPGAQITALPWYNPVSPGTCFLLFMTDVNGEVCTTSGIPYQGWDPWISPSEGSSMPGAPVTAASALANGKDLTLFIANPSGEIYTTSYHSGPVLQSITLSLHTQDHLDDNTLLHIFVKNRPSDSSATEGSTDYIGNFMAYQERDADWYSTNPYLGFAQGASKGQRLDDNSTTQINIPLRSQPIPLEEILLPVVNIHILTHGNNTWTFDYTITFTLDDGRQFPWSSNTNGITGIILDQDNINYSGICTEIQPVPAPTKPVTGFVLTAATIEFNTHNDDKNSSTTLNIHVVNRLNATSSLDISVMNDVDSGQAFPDSGDTYKRVDLTLVSNSIYLRDIVLPVVYINIGAGTDKWIFDYRVTFIFGQGQPYSWTASGIVLDQDRHKHMGVYNGRSFPSLARPQAALTPLAIKRNKSISLAYVQQKLQELFNSRQGLGDLNPIVKLRLDNTGNQGDQVPQSYLDTQWIEPAPPPPAAPQPPLGVTYSHSPSVLGQLVAIFGKIGVQLNDINSQALTLNVNSGNNQTPLALNLQFETGGPQEITGTLNIDVTAFEITIQLTLAYQPATNSVDLVSWVDDINGITFTPVEPPPLAGPPSYQIAGTFLGTPLSGTTTDPAGFSDALLGKVVDVVFTTSEKTDPGGIIQKALREGIFGKLNGSPDTITKVTLRQSLNATLNTWLMGGVTQSGNTELVPYPNPSQLPSPGGQHPENPVHLNNDVLTLDYFGPANSFVYQMPVDWGPLSQGSLANIDHIVVLTQENRSFDHMLGYLSLPYEKGGMNRTDVDGLKGGEFNMLNGQKCEVFRFAPGDTIFSPGPSNSVESVALSIFGTKLTDPIMGSFVLAHANDFGPATAPRVMGYHTADNVPTYDALARDFAICQRWFCSHPGSTFPNRFYELTGRPSIDPWGAWDYNDTLLPVFTDTIFDHLTDQGVSWKYFENGYCFLRTFERYTFDSQNLVSYDDPIAGFEELARTGNLPSVSFIDPHFVALPPGSTDDEAPSDIRESQPVIRRLVEALITSPAWNKTLLIITYDEHGGFYDHVPPVAAAKVSDELLPTTGVRVPTFVISPWVTGGTVFGSDEIWFDHTSILKTIARRFMWANPPYMGARYAAANDLSAVLGTKMRSGPFLPFIPYTVTYGASKKCLDVEGDRLAPGTLLWQYDPNPTTAQFSFEDEGDGYFYIRTTTGGFYLTVDAGLITDAAQYGIKLDVKYPSGGSGATNPNYQRWIFNVSPLSSKYDWVVSNPALSGGLGGGPPGNPDTPVGAFSCAAFPDMLLHPQGESPNSATPVVLEILLPPDYTSYLVPLLL